MIRLSRIRRLNRKHLRSGEFVLYWMQASQRSEYNHALEYSIRLGNALNRPVVVYFGITDRFPEANVRHYGFMLEGLKDTNRSLKERGIRAVFRLESPAWGAVKMAETACLMVTDMGYLRIGREWRSQVASQIDCPLIQVESDVVVPVEEASAREEYSAATMRRKITSKLGWYLASLDQGYARKDSLVLGPDSLDIDDTEGIMSKLLVDRSVSASPQYHGGTTEAKRHLDGFLTHGLEAYHSLRNDPSSDHQSRMSPYLHFGQISPLYVALRVLETGLPGIEGYLEELLVRRELSINFVHYNRQYDAFESLPDWARNTLLKHAGDHREHRYSREQLENALTHDDYWNAAQTEMRLTGKMHGYMRMYWGKRLIEWSETPQEAFETALRLNNKYEIDGRDPNSFAGVAWCFGKHDRPWPSSSIYGNVRRMTSGGLERKFDISKYVDRVRQLSRPQQSLG